MSFYLTTSASTFPNFQINWIFKLAPVRKAIAYHILASNFVLFIIKMFFH